MEEVNNAYLSLKILVTNHLKDFLPKKKQLVTLNDRLIDLEISDKELNKLGEYLTRIYQIQIKYPEIQDLETVKDLIEYAFNIIQKRYDP